MFGGHFVVIFIRKNVKEDFLCFVGVCEVVLGRHCWHFITTEVYLVLCFLLSRSLASPIHLHSLPLIPSLQKETINILHYLARRN